jgi:hypothetical protein
MRFVLLGLSLVACAEPYVPPPELAKQSPTRAPTSRLPDSSVRTEHVRGSVFRTTETVPTTRGAHGWGGRSGTFNDLTPVRR